MRFCNASRSEFRDRPLPSPSKHPQNHGRNRKDTDKHLFYSLPTPHSPLPTPD
ncbi:MAG: hypothetical protein MUF49_09900 [Oculatellaceae cyanobacterium Prado106]|nr:hypothetical protein [Oculatellaceae cyanobacterium Prado106]